MISVRKFWTIVFITIALSFSLLAYADTYWFKGNKVKDKDGTEYLIFNDEHKVQLGFKLDGVNLIPIKNSKTDSLRKAKQAAEKKAEKEKEIKEKAAIKKNVNNFSTNLLKLAMTFSGIFLTFIAVGLLGMSLYFIIALSLFFKKR